jgi:hypothetical protein
MTPHVVCCYIFPIIENRFFELARKFVASYQTHQAGLEHKLLVVLKGNPDPAASAQACEVFQCVPCDFLAHPNTGYDIASYIAVAQQSTAYELICCIGAYTSLRADNWLAKLCRPMQEDPQVGLAGAFGSCEESPHIRTSLFVLRTSFFRSMTWNDVITKQDGYMFEWGPDSLTQRMFARGATCMVVDCDGKAFSTPDWGKMGGFRQGDQSRLLAWDNHCEEFARGTPERKRYLSALAGFSAT